MKTGFEKALNIEFVEDKLTKEETSSAEELEKSKYSGDKWNLIR